MMEEQLYWKPCYVKQINRPKQISDFKISFYSLHYIYFKNNFDFQLSILFGFLN